MLKSLVSSRHGIWLVLRTISHHLQREYSSEWQERVCFRELRPGLVECFGAEGILCVHQLKGEMCTAVFFAPHKPVQCRNEKQFMEVLEDLLKTVRLTS